MLCEINPLIVTPEGEVRALDSKFTVDDNALYKHEDIAAMRDLDAYPPEERLAREKGVTYVKLDGEVGILGNGAGLVMSTLDVIALAGGRARELLRSRRRGGRRGRRRRARDHHLRPAGQIHPLQHLRRDHALRRGRARDPHRARPDGDRPPDRRPARRDERGGGSAAARGVRRADRRRAHDAGRGQASGGAGRSMTDLWTERAQAYRESESHASGPDLELHRRLGRGGDRARRRHRRRTRRAPARRGGVPGRDRRSRAGHGRRHDRARRGSPLRGRLLRHGRHAASRRTTSATCRRRSARWRASPSGWSSSRTRSTPTSASRRPSAPRPDPRALLLGGGVARVLRRRRARVGGASSTSRSATSSSRGSRAPDAWARKPTACASCWRT